MIAEQAAGDSTPFRGHQSKFEGDLSIKLGRRYFGPKRTTSQDLIPRDLDPIQRLAKLQGSLHYDSREQVKYFHRVSSQKDDKL